MIKVTSRAFLTGSHAYGAPRPDSDIDLVILVEDEAMEVLEAFGCPDGSASYGPMRFGKLNLIAETDPEKYQAWKRGTEELIEERRLRGAPIPREEACEHLRAIVDGVNQL